jgi:hypothetical protein
MTEAEWLDCGNPDRMLWYITRRGASARKRRLFACACCRRGCDLLTNEPIHQVIEAAEAFADGELAFDRLEATHVDGLRRFRAGTYYSWGVRAVAMLAEPDPVQDVHAAWCARMAVRGTGEEHAQSELLRDLFAPLFRPVRAEPAWLRWNDGMIPKLAQAIYQERAFERLPVLADALEEAGCASADVLDHCRRGGTHARGCWPLDLLTGRT